jgi:molybdopterin converting factor subunit 1
MRVRVRFFAALREHVKQPELEWELAADGTVGDLWEKLCLAFPGLDGLGGRVAFAVNREYVDRFHTLHDNDDVAIIPPVSGGTSHVPPHARSDRRC